MIMTLDFELTFVVYSDTIAQTCTFERQEHDAEIYTMCASATAPGMLNCFIIHDVNFYLYVGFV